MTHNLDQAKGLLRARTLVMGLLTTAALSAGLFALLQQRHHRQLNTEIVSAGGKVTLPPPISTIYWQRWHGRRIYEGTSVELSGNSLPRGFLRDRDYLRHLDITDLTVREFSGDAADVAELVAAHPLHQFIGTRMQGTNQIAAALHSKALMRSIWITKSDLTDDGFARLPLEEVAELNVSHTHVTPDGLLELKRCQNLHILWISGTQLDESSINVIGRLPNAVSLTVHDSVSVDSLRQFKDSRVRKIWLYNTSLSPEEIDQLQRDLLEIDVSEN